MTRAPWPTRAEVAALAYLAGSLEAAAQAPRTAGGASVFDFSLIFLVFL
jgi:hypothetical protein